MKKHDYFLSIKDIKKLLKNTEKEFNDSNSEYFHKKAEDGEIDARSAEVYVGMYASALKTYVKIVETKLKNLQAFKESENADDLRNK